MTRINLKPKQAIQQQVCNLHYVSTDATQSLLLFANKSAVDSFIYP